MVVMGDVNEVYVRLSNLIWDNPESLFEQHLEARNLLSKNIGQRLPQFHEAGFVHGDLGDMVEKDGFSDGSFLVIDFDSSGRMNQALYPLDLNRRTVWQSEEAVGGAIIQADHDRDM